ncbi:MTRF1L release factor glutamine methyltransferase [Corythoichthys intestinalis]|uniref:MTRF1L release factor glutamine methyltransferase n=1 Tax=Corythoichthys intestinalis TaxID=161448 RepID=UPI0025A651E2|nr:MTRF1L release factor glutamine methyltransferase [Corythoichthys intestinalis]XP_061813535.1 MTRF1L release factor glutamine methyltransferase-like [Nerophis lumbriciformis]
MWRKSASRGYICLMSRSVVLKEFAGSKAVRHCSSHVSPSGRITARQAADIWRKRFEAEGVTEPDLSSQYIIAHVLGAKTVEGAGRKKMSAFLTQEEAQRIWKLCEKRLSRMPVQYVIEEWDFRDLTLKMRPPVFIPRPETEELVELVLNDLQKKSGSLTCLEVGCGSGAISLSLLKNLPQLRVIALDQSTEAVELTRENALRLGLQNRLKVYHADVTKDAETVLKLCRNVSTLVSNPPYLFSEDLPSLEPEILRFEDHAALDGGKDGLQVIRKILTLAPHLLSDDGCIYLEVEPKHSQLIRQWAESDAKWLRLAETRYDITGRPRFCIFRRDESHDHKLHLG